MKKIMLLAIAILFMINFSFATNNPATENNNKVVKVVSKTFQYPSSAKDKLIEGYVLVSFVVDDEGNVNINQLYSAKKELAEYVQKELKQMVVEDLQPVPDQVYDMKIVFRLL